jgi:hypothetical protein
MEDSCAWFEHPGQSLDAAQTAKLERVCALLDLRPGSRLLDVGCGWGGLLVHAAQRHGVEAVGVTNNADRAELVRARLKEAELDDRVEVRLGTYADVEDGPYDAIAAIEATDHLSPEAVVEYGAAMQQLLRPGGRILHQQITGRVEGVQESQATFWGAYVFPDAHLLPLSAIVAAFDDTGSRYGGSGACASTTPRPCGRGSTGWRSAGTRSCARWGSRARVCGACPWRSPSWVSSGLRCRCTRCLGFGPSPTGVPAGGCLASAPPTSLSGQHVA